MGPGIYGGIVKRDENGQVGLHDDTDGDGDEGAGDVGDGREWRGGQQDDAAGDGDDAGDVGDGKELFVW